MHLSALPNISRAKLPKVYEQAKTALEDKIDDQHG